ncbi:MAG: hypothetical protein CL938_16305 [Deltaproteobacteria bacterium]|jgi:hypothetical protein|nr:hypothetical protein [Deltaproteobacteria bacterium]
MPALGLLLALALLAAGSPATANEPADFSAGRLWVPDAALGDVTPAQRHARWQRNVVNVAKPALALAGAALLGWGAWLRRAGHAGRGRRLRDALLALLGVAGFAGWWNFGFFHYPEFVHPHEFFHYTIGAKYYPELGYTRLYTCTTAADVEAGLGARVATRRMTDLENYELVPAAEAAADPQRCKQFFSPERWKLFTGDIAWFRERMEPDAWEQLQRDHGYNPTPVWGILGRALLGDGPLRAERVATLSLVDPMLIVSLWALAALAFGWRAACVGLLYWGTNHPAEYSWVGGAYLRHDWLLASVAGFALLRHRRPVAAGFLLGWASLLRVFPALFLAPVAFRALGPLRRDRRLAPVHRGIALGTLLAVALGVPLSIWSSGGSAWPAFAENARVHAAALSNNALGLGVLVHHVPDASEKRLAERGQDLGRAWKQARRTSRSTRWPLFFLLAALLVAGIAWASRRVPDWEAAILGVGLVPILLEPAGYYTSIFLAYAFLRSGGEAVGAALCLLSVAGWLAAALWLQWDEIAVATSAALILFIGVASWLAGRRAVQAEP